MFKNINYSKYKMLPAAILYIILFALSFPLVIPGQKTPVFLHELFGCYIVFFVFPVYLYFIDNIEGLRRRWVAGSLAASFASLTVFYWAYYAIHVYGSVSIPLTLGVLIFMMCGEGFIFWGTFILLYSFLQKRGRAYPILVAAVWTSVEAVRNFFPVDFYWAAIGHSQYDNRFFLQFAAVGANYILSFFIVWASVLAYSWIKKERRLKETVAFAIFFIVMSVYSIHRLTVFPSIEPKRFVKVGILQPNINQDDVNDKERLFDEIMSKYSVMINSLDKDTELLVWHEAALPIRIPRGFTDFRRVWDKFFPDTVLFNRQIIGLDIVDVAQERYYNSAGFIENGRIAKVYDKIKLAPYGEYLPMADLLNSIGMSLLIPNSVGSFERGKEYSVYDYGLFKAAILICYDGTFSENVRGFVQNGANLLVNITNDAWFGYSSAAYQHHSFYPFRAVETGRTIIRAANIGISGVILPDGSRIKETDIYTQEAFNYKVPIYEIDTPYLLYGNFFLWIIVAYSLLSLIYFGVRNGKNRKP